MKSKKLINTLEDVAKRYWDEFMSDEDWNDSTEYLYYKIHLLESQLKKERTKNAGLMIWLNIENGAKAALCECSPDMQIIGCPAGDACYHNNIEP